MLHLSNSLHRLPHLITAMQMYCFCKAQEVCFTQMCGQEKMSVNGLVHSEPHAPGLRMLPQVCLSLYLIGAHCIQMVRYYIHGNLSPLLDCSTDNMAWACLSAKIRTVFTSSFNLTLYPQRRDSQPIIPLILLAVLAKNHPHQFAFYFSSFP